MLGRRTVHRPFCGPMNFRTGGRHIVTPRKESHAPREPEIVSLEPSATAVIRDTVPVDRLPEFFDRAFGTLAPTLARQGTGIAGAAFALYHGQPADTADLEVGLPTVGPAAPDGDITVGSLPGGRAARLVHSGGSEGAAKVSRLRWSTTPLVPHAESPCASG